MPSFKTTAVAVIALLLSAQAQVQYYITPDSVPLATRRRFIQRNYARNMLTHYEKRNGATRRWQLALCSASSYRVSRQRPLQTPVMP